MLPQMIEHKIEKIFRSNIFQKLIFWGYNLYAPPSPGDPIASRDLKLYKKLHIDTSNLCYKIHYSIYNMLDMMSSGILLKTSKNG